MLANVDILSDQNCKEMTKQIMHINSRLKLIQVALVHSSSTLSEGIGKILFDLNETMIDNFTQFRAISLETALDVLGEINNGLLCVKVYNALQKSERKTPLEIILRALLSPESMHKVEELAMEKTKKKLEIFQREMDILLTLTRKGRVSKSQMRRTERLKIIRDNLEEFDCAKEAVDNTQEDLN